MIHRQLIAVMPEGVGRHHADADPDPDLLMDPVEPPPSPPLPPIDTARPVREMALSMIAAAPNLTSPANQTPVDG